MDITRLIGKTWDRVVSKVPWYLAVIPLWAAVTLVHYVLGPWGRGVMNLAFFAWVLWSVWDTSNRWKKYLRIQENLSGRVAHWRDRALTAERVLAKHYIESGKITLPKDWPASESKKDFMLPPAPSVTINDEDITQPVPALDIYRPPTPGVMSLESEGSLVRKCAKNG